jgi:hypothetical protein
MADPTEGAVRFEFAFDPGRMRTLAASFGVRPATAWVEVSAEELRVRFGPWRLRTERSNIAAAEVTGPYRHWWKVAGPARLSVADRGVTFGTSLQRGVCMRFHRPVPALAPGPWLRHPGATVTVAEPERLLAVLDLRSPGSGGPPAGPAVGPTPPVG